MTNQSPLHPRNPHRGRYDLFALGKTHKPLNGFIQRNPMGGKTINFANPSAVVALNTALLKHYYGLKAWHIPKGFLCPPIPGRADYIHHLADLLGEPNFNPTIRVLDIGTGANLIYPIIAQHSYGWKVVGTDINTQALNNAQTLIEENSLGASISLRHQADPRAILAGIINADDSFDAVLCNPPFHRSAEEANAGSERKTRQLSRHKRKKMPVGLNFGGSNAELWCEGGEVWFVSQMIRESERYATQVKWFSSLVAKQEDMPAIIRLLKKTANCQYQVIDMAQGNKVSRLVAWRFESMSQG
ncbi:23S rRNA (adenine(1618)-N(6))-methyltransferase RlmF [Umboniibacter marinipuniceus]|uniref:Ribosomal RNA large subunit methyltransferase F n=1 Tax=Umboniibacter marinipuniceus TaxID=569599 RepID=A0A3M0AFP5_9GAMM|nr:23S rRNA (adenine(1618)-N(6))-methyltransferase RlmF [Umboniibacter marinipuniceus]RMA81305.1 23S rRNA m(6)A-1618 methyltransferase [Umboniibacter marinipuniceus]